MSAIHGFISVNHLLWNRVWPIVKQVKEGLQRVFVTNRPVNNLNWYPPFQWVFHPHAFTCNNSCHQNEVIFCNYCVDISWVKWTQMDFSPSCHCMYAIFVAINLFGIAFVDLNENTFSHAHSCQISWSFVPYIEKIQYTPYCILWRRMWCGVECYN